MILRVLTAACAISLASAPGAALFAQSAPSPLSDAEITSRWGALAVLPGHYWKATGEGRDKPTIRRYKWREKGRVLERRTGTKLSLWELKPDGEIVIKDGTGKVIQDFLKVQDDGSVSYEQTVGEISWIRSFKLVDSKTMQVLTTNPTNRQVFITEVYIRLTDDTQPQKLQRAIFDSEAGEEPTVISAANSLLKITGRYGVREFRQSANGSYISPETSKAIRILGVDVVETYDPSNVKIAPTVYIRRNSPDPVELEYGLFKLEGLEDQAGGTVFQLRGDTLIRSDGPTTVGDYIRGSDGLYHDPHGSGSLRIVDRYSVDLLPPRGVVLKTYRFTRADDVAPTYIAEARQKMNRWMAGYEAELDAQDAQDQRLTRQNEQYRQSDAIATNNAGNILGAFAKGLADATASNAAIERSMRNAANEGIARGTAEYARRQAEQDRRQAPSRTSASASNGAASGGGSANIVIVPPTPNSAPSPQRAPEAATREMYAWCRAQKPGTLVFSSVQRITVPSGWSWTPMANRFGADVGGAGLCSATADRASAESEISQGVRAYPNMKIVRTTTVLKP